MKYNTGKKKQVVEFLSDNSQSAFTLEEIVARIAPDGKGKSTVYRIVSELVEKSIVKRISDGKTRHCSYQYIGAGECKSHLHLKCRDCGKLIHLDRGISESFTTALRESGGFTLEYGCMLFGKCEKCEADGNADNDTKNHTHGGLCCDD